MTDQPTKIKQILEYWKENYPIISNVRFGNRFPSQEEFKDTTQYLNKCFSPAILKLLKSKSIDHLHAELPELVQYICRETNSYEVIGSYGIYNVYELNSENKNEYLQKLDDLKILFQEIDHIDFYMDLYDRGDRVIELSKEKYDKRISELLSETNEIYLYSEYKKQADEVGKRIIINIWILRGLLIAIPVIHIIIHWVLLKLGMNSESIASYLTKLLFIIPFVWMILFTIKNIREDRKIEQTYKHKEIVARTYLNFLDMLNKNPYLDDDGKTRKILSRIAIESMGLNPALLLDKSTAEKIPMEELLTRMMDRASGNSDGASQQK